MSTEEFLEAKLAGRWTTGAATGLAPGALKTWDPLLPREPRFLVPIDVQALVVPAGGSTPVLPTETVLPTSEGGWPTRPQAFADATETLAPGVHLHWAMPDALTRGEAGRARGGDTPAGNPIGLPALPDRFVVVRLVLGSAQRTAFVLEADVGTHAPLPGWREPGPRPSDPQTGDSGRRYYPRERLHAMSGGDVAWAATYRAVLDRFAFHDTLADLSPELRDHGRFSYLVAGWWTDEDLDPLAGADGISAYVARLESLRWTVPDFERLAAERDRVEAERAERQAQGILHFPPSSASVPRIAGQPVGHVPPHLGVLEAASALDRIADANRTPRHTLLHGAVFGVEASGAGLDRRPAPEQLELAVGGSAFAALAALLADGQGEERLSSERVLAAFSANLLSGIDAPGGLALVDEERHTASFTALPGGQRARPDRVATGERVKVVPGDPPARSRGGRGEATAIAPQVARAILDEKAPYRLALDRFKRRQPSPRSSEPFGYREVAAALPRFYVPNDPVLLLRGAGRSLRHGGDGRFDDHERLGCRTSADIVESYDEILERADLPPSLQTLETGAIPQEIERLMSEAVLIDPYRVQERVTWSRRRRGLPEAPVLQRMRAETLLRYPRPVGRFGAPSIPDHARDQLLQLSAVAGADPSPIGRTVWGQAWVPLWCEVEVAAALDAEIGRWTLGAIDLEPGVDALTAAERTLRVRVPLASSSARALAGDLEKWLEAEDQRDSQGKGELDEDQEALLATAAQAARWLDVMHTSLDGLRATWLGLDPERKDMTRIDAQGRALTRPLALRAPELLAGGALRLTRLRVIDAFGRWLDAPASALAALETASTHEHPQGGGRVLLRPRVMSKARLWFRFVDARTTDDADAFVDQQDPAAASSPLAGWLLPDHVDEALEVFDREGTPLGQLMHDPLTGAVVWEGAPGTPGPLGVPPDTAGEPASEHLRQLVTDLIAADAAARSGGAPVGESALSALLRAIDTTSWTIDPLGALGTGPIAGLVGRPIAVLRATLRLEVPSDVAAVDFAGDDAATQRAARERAFAELAARPLPVRLGELTRTDDGLLGYVPDGPDRRMRVTAPEVRSHARARRQLDARRSPPPETLPITHPYVSTDPHLTLHSNHLVRLTLLMAPGSRVYATAGVVPRKSLALAREWTHPAIERLSPSFRVGPVLVEPSVVRMPKVTGLGPKQGFIRKRTPLSWLEDPITAATQTAYLPDDPHGLEEGWIRVRSAEEDETP